MLHEICRNLVNYKHQIGYPYQLLSELKLDNRQNHLLHKKSIG